MDLYIETERLILRPFGRQDRAGLFALDSNPNVLKYIGIPPLQKLEETDRLIDKVHKQYLDHGTGRLSAIDKKSQEFIGWGGIKYEQNIREENYYDLGYRIIEEYWGKGFGTEIAKASLAIGFQQLKLNEIYAAADAKNIASNVILKKCGGEELEPFEFEGISCTWYRFNSAE